MENVIKISNDNGELKFNDENVDIISVYIYSNSETKELFIWKKNLYTNDMDRYCLDILYSLQNILTKDNRKEFKVLNRKLNKLFHGFTNRLTKLFIERQEATRTDLHLEDKKE